MKTRRFSWQAARGFTLLEALVTMAILAFGLLGLVGLQSKISIGEVESFQRAQAILLLWDMADRISANRGNAASYVSASIGTGDSQAADFDCTTVAIGNVRDICEWSNALKGSAERKASADAGAMVGARGCIEELQPAAVANCTPGIYRVTVAWQGLNKTAAPSLTCANAAGLYGDPLYRRAIAARVTVGQPTCVIGGAPAP